jgi:hypothetical protein
MEGTIWTRCSGPGLEQVSQSRRSLFESLGLLLAHVDPWHLGNSSAAASFASLTYPLHLSNLQVPCKPSRHDGSVVEIIHAATSPAPLILLTTLLDDNDATTSTPPTCSVGSSQAITRSLVGSSLSLCAILDDRKPKDPPARPAGD